MKFEISNLFILLRSRFASKYVLLFNLLDLFIILINDIKIYI